MKKTPIFALATMILAAGRLSVAANRAYHYEPENVVLSGKIERQTFPGPPNYEDIKTGDQIETGWYLRLDEMIDVNTSKQDTDPNAESEKDIKVLQLAFNPDGPARKTEAETGKRICLRGHLFHSLTGHHHSRVLLWVDEVLKVKP